MSKSSDWETHYLNVAKARSDGFEIVFADDKTLLLDLDTEAQKEQYNSLKPWFCDEFGRESDQWKSKSGNTHIVLSLNAPMAIELRIAMQVIMGSDPKRGFSEILHVINKANPIVLFKPKSSVVSGEKK